MVNKMLLFGLLFALVSCKKYDRTAEDLKNNVLPPITSSGQQTFGFLFNNTVWITHNIPQIIRPAFKVEYSDTRGLYIYCERRNRVNVEITDAMYLVFKDVSLGSRALSVEKGDNIQIRTYQPDLGPDASDQYLVIDSGELRISRFDTVNHIISGEFNMEIRNYERTKNASISSGRFDIKYDPES